MTGKGEKALPPEKQKNRLKSLLLLKGIGTRMKLYNETQGRMTKEQFTEAVDKLLIDARAKLERLKDDDSDEAYYLSLDLEKAVHRFDIVADYLEEIYNEIVYYFDN